VYGETETKTETEEEKISMEMIPKKIKKKKKGIAKVERNIQSRRNRKIKNQNQHHITPSVLSPLYHILERRKKRHRFTELPDKRDGRRDGRRE
jgi:hypothetical protein